MKIIVYNRIVGGHHLEYIHHLYCAASKHKDDTFYFILPKNFDSIKSRLEWPHSNNIEFDLFGETNDLKTSLCFWETIRNSWNNTVLASRYVKKYNADVLYTNSLMELVPFAPLLIRKTTRVIGIIYSIYLYEAKGRSTLTKRLDRLKYIIMSKCGVYNKVLILNDKEGANNLNAIYKTSKFVSIPDPFVPINVQNLIDFRREYNVQLEKKLFVQFGALSSNKGTIEILESLDLLTDEEREHFAFAFMGLVNEDISNLFFNLIEKNKNRVQIICQNEYCSYELLASLCLACDAILTPYKRTAQSSGLIGYAAQFHKPVIAPAKGLLGRLVSDYHLGILINDVDSVNLVQAYRQIASGEYVLPVDDYCTENSVTKFQECIMSTFK